ncbi:MAG: hypothetical protein HYY84_03535 [Deltaproteobacteria bacterium]|nr:hypothetical protein [Deltaproteobacteria bacterium]
MDAASVGAIRHALTVSSAWRVRVWRVVPSVPFALATNLWFYTGNEISDPVFFYIGGQVAGFVKYKRFTAQIPIDVGVLPFFSPTVYAVTIAFLAGVSF